MHLFELKDKVCINPHIDCFCVIIQWQCMIMAQYHVTFRLQNEKAELMALIKYQLSLPVTIKINLRNSHLHKVKWGSNWVNVIWTWGLWVRWHLKFNLSYSDYCSNTNQWTPCGIQERLMTTNENKTFLDFCKNPENVHWSSSKSQQ